MTASIEKAQPTKKKEKEKTSEKKDGDEKQKEKEKDQGTDESMTSEIVLADQVGGDEEDKVRDGKEKGEGENIAGEVDRRSADQWKRNVIWKEHTNCCCSFHLKMFLVNMH